MKCTISLQKYVQWVLQWIALDIRVWHWRTSWFPTSRKGRSPLKEDARADRKCFDTVLNATKLTAWTFFFQYLQYCTAVVASLRRTLFPMMSCFRAQGNVLNVFQGHGRHPYASAIRAFLITNGHYFSARETCAWPVNNRLLVEHARERAFSET